MVVARIFNLQSQGRGLSLDPLSIPGQFGVQARFSLVRFLPMNSSPANISTEEQEQLLQTIEMFEVIMQANPTDTQSMDILKDAYARMGRTAEMLGISRKLAETYFNLGQYSSSLLEYEAVLQQDPTNPEIIAALGEVEERLQKAGHSRPPVAPAAPTSISLDFRAAVADTGTLMTTAQTMRSDGGRSGPRPDDVLASLIDDGNEPLSRFLIQHRLASEDVVASALERVQKKNRDLPPNTFAASLIDEVVRRGAAELEPLLCGILDRSKFAYIPLDVYDVDRQIVKMLPDSITLGRLIAPFDVISRTIMIATANPFDSEGKQAVQQLLDYNIQWHLAAPRSILKVLSDTYRIPMPTSADHGTNGSAFSS